MASWLDRLTQRVRKGPTDPLAALRDYPPYRAPHVGPPSTWTLAQAEENLAHLLRHRGERLANLGEWLRAHAGIDIRPALLGGDVRPLLDDLHRWATTAWPAWHVPALATPTAWLRSTRTGDEIVFSLLFDIALLMGELITTRHPGYRWALNLDPVDERDGMPSWRRPVLMLPRQDPMPADIDIDLEEMMVVRYQHPGNVTEQLFNRWAEVVTSAASGKMEAVWLGERTLPR